MRHAIKSRNFTLFLIDHVEVDTDVIGQIALDYLKEDSLKNLDTVAVVTETFTYNFYVVVANGKTEIRNLATFSSNNINH